MELPLSIKTWSWMTICLAGVCASCPADDGLFHWLKERVRDPFHRSPRLLTMTALADQIDKVEERLLDDGVIVVKQPDVWGQARMTSYRSEFEAAMKQEIGNFKGILSAKSTASNGTSTTSSSSFNIAALSSGAKPGEANAASLVAPANSAPAVTQTGFFQPIKDGVLKSETIGGSLLDGRLGLEPTVLLDEKKRFLDHLNEIRRVNLGDDISVAPGYGLYLFRLPVSIQPGERTLQGCGAQLWITVRPEFTNRFLPITIRNLIVAELVDHMAPIVGQLIDRNLDEAVLQLASEAAAVETECRRERARLLDLFARVRAEFPRELLGADSIQLAREAFLDSIAMLEDQSVDCSHAMKSVATRLRGLMLHPEFARLAASVRSMDPKALALKVEQCRDRHQRALGLPDENARLMEWREAKLHEQAMLCVEAQKHLNETRTVLESLEKLLERMEILRSRINGVATPAQRIGNRSFTVPATDVAAVYRLEGLAMIAQAIKRLDPAGKPREGEIRGFLRNELEATYDAVGHRCIGKGILADTQFVHTVFEAICQRRYQMIPLLFQQMEQQLPGDIVGRKGGLLAALSWTIVVKAALLNQRLLEDIERVLNPQDHHDHSLAFYAPEPTDDAVRMFHEYVIARWPLVTFALDPVIDQQNLADAYSQRRNLQLAVGLAFANGKINYNQLMRFMRQVELDTETISLNRTVIAYALGHETFGWRFLPRFQTPPRETSHWRSFQDLFHRSSQNRDYQARYSRLEPGQRELTAVLIMPSFLQKVRFEMSTNWFRLNDPDELVVPTSRMLEHGREVIELRELMASACDVERYRAEDLSRLLAKVDQLEAMLPLQTRMVDVPYENTLGGFELFTPGATALAPELTGYEGAESIAPNQTTDLILHGKNISLNETKVVAGGRSIPSDKVEIMSREIMRIQVPADVRPTVTEKGARGVEIMIATPNGVSGRLLVPYDDGSSGWSGVKSPAPAPAPLKMTGQPVPAANARR